MSVKLLCLSPSVTGDGQTFTAKPGDGIVSYLISPFEEAAGHATIREMEAVGNGKSPLADLAGPYAHLAELLIEALKDKQITADEATGMGLELAHVTGAKDKVFDLVGGLISKLTGKKK